MYSAYNEGQSVVGKRFITALKNKVFKCMYSKCLSIGTIFITISTLLVTYIIITK